MKKFKHLRTEFYEVAVAMGKTSRESALPSGLGCGHGLLCGVEVKGK